MQCQNIPIEAAIQYETTAPSQPPTVHTVDDAEFVVPRKTMSPPQNTWGPTIELSNSFSALSDSIAFDDDIVCELDRPARPSTNNVTIRKRPSVHAASKQQQQKRPTITTTEAYLKNFVPFVPGRKLYAQASVNGTDVLVIGSSMLQRIRNFFFHFCG